MSLHVIEGTWEEIERRKSELIGRHLRVIITPEKPVMRKQNTPAQKTTSSAPPHRVSAMGKYAGILSTEDYFRDKQEDIDLEDRARE